MNRYPEKLDIKKSHTGKKIFEISDARLVIKKYIVMADNEEQANDKFLNAHYDDDWGYEDDIRLSYEKDYIEDRECYTKEIYTIKEDDFVLQSSEEDYGHFEIGDSDYDYEGVCERNNI